MQPIPNPARRSTTTHRWRARSIRGAVGQRDSTVATREDEVTMAKLTAKQREKLPAKAFGLPERAAFEEGQEGIGQLPDARPGSRHQRDPPLGAGAATGQPHEGRVRAHQSEGPQDPEKEEEEGQVSAAATGRPRRR